MQSLPSLLPSMVPDRLFIHIAKSLLETQQCKADILQWKLIKKKKKKQAQSPQKHAEMLWVWLPVLTVFPASCHLKKKEVQECVCACMCVCVPTPACEFLVGVWVFPRVSGWASRGWLQGGDHRKPSPCGTSVYPGSAWVPRVPLHFPGSGNDPF